MGRIFVGDGKSHKRLIQYDPNSVFTSSLLAPGTGILTYDYFLLMPSQNPIFALQWRTSTSRNFDIICELHTNVLFPPYRTFYIAQGITNFPPFPTAGNYKGDAFPIYNKNRLQPPFPILGWVRIGIFNNDNLNSLDINEASIYTEEGGNNG